MKRLLLIFVLTFLALLTRPSAGQAAFSACCCQEQDGVKVNCKFATLETNQYCNDVLGVGWITEDDRYCTAAIGTETTAEDKVQVQFRPNVTIPNSVFQEGAPVRVTGTTIGDWISALYVFLSGAIGIMAALMVLWGGFKWLTAAGNSGRVNEAKDIIYNAIIAILLTLGAYVLLRTINPDLVKIKDITSLVKPIPRVEQLGELFAPPRVSEAILADSSKALAKNQFNALACPSVEEMRAGFAVYLTGYYRPAWNTTGNYSSFACNLGMQCRCPRLKTMVCTAGGLTWLGCDLDKVDQNEYCNRTASGAVPSGMFGGSEPYTAAASSCFGAGTIFKLERSGDASMAVDPFSKKWVVQDTGPDIQGRHLDLFFGTGDPAHDAAINVTGPATMKIDLLCDSQKRCEKL